MSGAQPQGLAGLPAVAVAGHICLDVIPTLPADSGRGAPRPGGLERIGPVTLALGGCVGNTGVALRRLGANPVLIARVGDDRLGQALEDLVHEAVPLADSHLRRVAGGLTSCSLIANRPGADRAIQHFAGVNDTFIADDVPWEALKRAALIHVGYPPLMAAMVADDGSELLKLHRQAHAMGLTTSLDMAAVDRRQDGDQTRWRRLLARVLPEVDLFMPSLAEAGAMLGRRVRRTGSGAPDPAALAQLAADLIELGVAIVGIKLGEAGLYVRTAPAVRLDAVPGRLPPDWADREVYRSVFETDVVGTTGAGDATIAGFLFSLLRRTSLDEAITTASAVGACSTEAADGTGGVPSWPQIEHRLLAGWPRRTALPGAGWSPSADPGLWYGPHDARGSRS